MDNSNSLIDTTTYSLIDTDSIPQRDTETDISDWFEDAASEGDWADSSPACSVTEDPIQARCIMDELYGKNKLLERQWKEAEQRYQNLLLENQKLNIQLSNERHRANKYHKKLQYIQENYEMFNRLKQAYLNMKYNQTTGKSMVEIKETACQTWQGILCASCIQTAEMNRQAELARLCSFTGSEPEMITVKRSDLTKMQETVDKLKNKIDEREQSWSYNETKENRYKSIIAYLQRTVEILNETIARRPGGIEVTKSPDNDVEAIQKENGFLRKIIIKLEKRQRDMEKIIKPEKRPPLLNQQEKSVVQLLIKKYAHKLQQKGKRNSPFDFGASPLPSPISLIDTPSSSFPAENGSGEGTSATFSVPLTTAYPAVDFTEQAEKPMSPKKEEVYEEVDLIDFSDSVCF